MLKQTNKRIVVVLLWLITIALVSTLLHKVLTINNDKEMLVFVFYYGVIFVFNMVLAIPFIFIDNEIIKTIRNIGIVLFLAFIPLMILIANS